MWYLTSETDCRVLYVLPNKEIVIGRSVEAQLCNFAIPKDASISRKHATLTVSKNNLYIEDNGSRYGTFINDMNNKIEQNTKIKLNGNDVVKLGKISSIWRAHEMPLVTCVSTLKGENLERVKKTVTDLGGVVKNEWDDSCEYLTMPAITLTLKVVLALAQGSHIVTTSYWDKCLEAVNTQRNLPEPSGFVPHVLESTLNKQMVSFLPNENRKKLFTGKTLIFFSRRQLDMYKNVLIKCAAQSLLLSESKMSKSALCEENMVVIQYNIANVTQDTQAQRDQITEIINYLKSKGKRAVADAEIGLAILFCSTEKYCNPDFNFSTEVIKQASAGQNAKPANILAQESQEPMQQITNENVVIDESLTQPNFKRKLGDEDSNIVMNANKKFAIDIDNSNTSNESMKRKFSNDGNGDINPSKKRAIENDEVIFDFLNTSESDKNKENTERKLNLAKPHKKQDYSYSGNDDEDLFNFVQDKSKTSNQSDTNNIFDNHCNDEIETINKQKPIVDQKVDFKALRGSKLKELTENINFTNVTVKKEDPDDLNKKMNDLDLGTTIIKVRSDLVVKKEPISIEIQDNKQRNFKKFQKVWPVKMQVTMIPKSSMNIVIPDNRDAGELSSMSY